MTDLLKRIEDWHRRNSRVEDVAVDSSRRAVLSKEAFVDRIDSAPICYGYCAVTLIPTYREVVDGGAGDSQIAFHSSDTGVIKNTTNNQGIFGAYLNNRTVGDDKLLIQQAVVCAGEIRNPLAIFVNGESYGFDGWAGKDTDDSKWKFSAHLFNVGSDRQATALATNYSDNRNASDKYTNLTVVTGLYHGSGRFGGTPPEVYLYLEGVRSLKMLNRDGTLSDNTEGSLESHGTYGALLDYLTSSRGLGLSPSVLDYASWSRRDYDSILSTNYREALPFTVRMRNLSFESDAAPIEGYTYLSCPIPLKANWPCWGVIDTSQSIGTIFQQFSRSCPPLKLFYRLNGKLAANAVSLFRRVDYDVVATLTDSDIISINTYLEERRVNVRFENYELDFVSDTVGDTEVTDTVHADLCGSVYHADKIWEQLNARNNLENVQITASRRFMGLEPGDVVRVRSENVQGLVYIDDCGTDEELRTLLIGKLLAVVASSVEDVSFFQLGYRGVRAGRDVNLKVPDVSADQGNVDYRVDSLPDGLVFDEVTKSIRGKI